MAGEGVDVDIEYPDLHALISALKDVDPKLATNFRRELRASGDIIIAEQRRVLAQRPGRIRRSGKTLRLIQSRGKKPYFAFRNTYSSDAPREGGVSNLRDKIAAGLKTRVTATDKRQSIEIRTSGPRQGGYNLARVWQKSRFRHPIFQTGQWMDQAGQPYFFEPATKEFRDLMRERIQTAIEQALPSGKL